MKGWKKASCFAAGGVLALSLTACSTLPDQVDALTDAEDRVRTLASHPSADGAASSELQEAQRYLKKAQSAYDESRDLEVIEHYSYMAERYADIGFQRLAEAKLRDEVDRNEAAEKEILLESKSREVDRAQAQARALQQELAAMNAKNTQRGIMLTLDSVLFSVDGHDLQRGAAKNMDRLAEVLDKYPDRRVLIEGHTDSTGSEEYNQKLSQDRADAVSTALKRRGIDSSRILTKGLGEDYPVASNDSEAGRQQNRRVEIVISDEEGQFPSSAQRG